LSFTVFPIPEMRTVCILFLASFLVACAAQGFGDDVSFMRYTSETFPPTERVEIFPDDVEKGYIIIGELKMTFPSELSHGESVNQMKQVASEIGADAIIGLEKEIIEAPIPPVFDEPGKRKARHQPLDISTPEAREEKILLRGLAIRYR